MWIIHLPRKGVYEPATFSKVTDKTATGQATISGLHDLSYVKRIKACGNCTRAHNYTASQTERGTVSFHFFHTGVYLEFIHPEGI